MVDMLLDFSGTSGDVYSLVFNLVHIAYMLDKDVLLDK